MYISTSTAILPLLPTLPQTSTSAGYSNCVSLISSHITRAEAIINAKISSRYDLSGYTSTNCPPILRMLTEDIAGYYTLRSYYTSDNQNVSEWVEKFGEATAMLDMIRDGKMDLADTSGNIVLGSTTAASVDSNTIDFDPTFSEDTSLNWIVDTDKF